MSLGARPVRPALALAGVFFPSSTQHGGRPPEPPIPIVRDLAGREFLLTCDGVDMLLSPIATAPTGHRADIPAGLAPDRGVSAFLEGCRMGSAPPPLPGAPGIDPRRALDGLLGAAARIGEPFMMQIDAAIESQNHVNARVLAELSAGKTPGVANSGDASLVDSLLAPEGLLGLFVGAGSAALNGWLGAASYAAGAAAAPMGSLATDAISACLGDGPESLADDLRELVCGIESAADVPVAFTHPLDAPGVVTVGGSAVARVMDEGTIPSETDNGPITQGNGTILASGIPVAGEGHAVAGHKGATGAVDKVMCHPQVLMGKSTVQLAEEPPPGEGDGAATAGEGPPSAAGEESAASGRSEGGEAQGAGTEGRGSDLVEATSDKPISAGAAMSDEHAKALKRVQGDFDQTTKHLKEAAGEAQTKYYRGLAASNRGRIPAGVDPGDYAAAVQDTLGRDAREAAGALKDHLDGGRPTDLGPAGASKVWGAMKILDPIIGVGQVAFEWASQGIDAAAEKAVQVGASAVAGGAAAAGAGKLACTPAVLAKGIGYPICVGAVTVTGFTAGAAAEIFTKEGMEWVKEQTAPAPPPGPP